MRAFRVPPPLVAVIVLAGALILFCAGVTEPQTSAAELALLQDATEFVDNGARDLDGQPWPLFPQTAHGRRPPIPFYAAVVSDAWWRNTPTRARYLAAVAGAVSVSLTYLAARAVLGEGLAVLAAVLLATTPAFVLHSRMIVDEGVWVVPFVIAFVAGIVRVLALHDAQRRHVLTVAAATLALSAYAQPSGALIALCIGAVSAGVVASVRPDRGIFLLVFGAVALVLAPAAIVTLATPEVYAETFGAWLLHPAHLRNPVEWAYAATNHNAMRQTAHAFWDFFSPAHLLFADGQPAIAGVFLFTTGALAVVGSRDVLRRSSAQTIMSRPWWLILGATLASVFAMALFREERAVDRALVVAPLAVLLSARGVLALSTSRAGRIGLGVATMLAVTQFAIWFWQVL